MSNSSIFKFRFDTSTTAQNKKSDKKSNKDFVKSINPFAKNIVFITIVSVLYAYTFILTTRVFGDLIDLFITAIIGSILKGDSTIENEAIKWAIIKAGALIVANTVFSFLQGSFSARFASNYAHKLRQKLFDKFHRLPLAYIDSHYYDDIHTMLTDSVDAMNQSMNMILGKILSSALIVVGIIVELFKIDVIMVTIVCGIIVIGFIVIYCFSNNESKLSVAHQKGLHDIHGEINELYGGIKTVQASGNCDRVVNEIVDMSEQLNTTVKKARRVASVPSIITELITSLSFIAVLIVGAVKIHEGAVSLGVLITAIIYIRKLNEPLTQFNSFSGVFSTLNFTKNKIFSFLREPEVQESENNESIEIGDITFENVDFEYFTNQKVIHNASFTIKQKGITAITGETGAGKSTIIKLVLRFYSPVSGRILMNQKDISSFGISDYRQRFTVIPQNARLFDCNIRENIVYGMKNITDEQVMEVIEKVGATEFIQKLPEGIYTKFNSASPNISAGQIQLVLLARAMLRKCSYIIFDEATSYIDADTESKFNDLLKTLSKDCGIIIIAHRKTAIDIAETIIEIGDGRVSNI